MIVTTHRFRQGINVDYYLNHHVPLSEEVMVPLGLSRAQVVVFGPGPDGKLPEFQVMTTLCFPSWEVFNSIMQNPALKQLFDDTPNFYTGEWPEIMVGEVVVDKDYEKEKKR